MSLLRWIASWSLRHFLMFVLIVVALAAFVALKREYDRRPVLQAERAALQNQSNLLGRDVDEQIRQAGSSANEIGGMTKPRLQERLAAIRSEKASLNVRRLSAPGFGFRVMTGDTASIARDLAAHFRLQLLLREQALILRTIDLIDRKIERGGSNAQQIQRRIDVLEMRIEAIETRYPNLTRVENVPVIQNFVGPWRELQRTKAARDRETERLSRWLAADAAVRRAERKFQDTRTALTDAVPPTRWLDRAVKEKGDELSRNWMTMMWRAAKPVLGWALAILAAVVLIPPAIKAFWFFVVARRAAGLAPVRIRPELAGEIGWATGRVADGDGGAGSAASRRIVLRAGDELLIKPEYLQSSMNDARIDTGVVLNRNFLFASLATGLAGLTRIRADRESFATVSATRDMIDEIGVIEIAAGSAMVFQPRNLVGVLQRRDRPLRIESVWRAGHVSSWLTMQLRYLVFHGPCALIVKGARGVALEPAEKGRRIAGAATMGWSAGLGLSVRRSETFFAYLTGKQSLFNDSFDGPDGKIVHEQMPRAGATSGFWGRGLEGIGDGLMKVVGL